jgi:zinc protease
MKKSTHVISPAIAPIETILAKLNKGVSKTKQIQRGKPVSFGGHQVEQLTFGNGLRVLILVDTSAPVVSYNTWYRVGSRHERKGKTGIAHLFEHLMFNETKTLPAGRFDQLLERAGAETNAATWTDWTYYYENLPRDQFALAVRLEADRMHNLVLREKPVASEKEVVANERRYRVDDDVDGTMSEALWSHAFKVHPYHHPTIGWMKDILSFTPEDCRAFYKTWYAPNNATVVLVGDIDLASALPLMVKHYGPMKPARIPKEKLPKEPVLRPEVVVKIKHATPTDKLAVGYRTPGMADADHTALSVLMEALTGGRSSRLYRDFVTDNEIAADVSGWASTFRDPGLWEINVTAREGHNADRLLQHLDAAFETLLRKPISKDERDRAVARMELHFLRNLETAGGKAEQIGFFDTVLGDPGGGFARLEAVREVTPSMLHAVASKYLTRTRRTIVKLNAQLTPRST